MKKMLGIFLAAALSLSGCAAVDFSDDSRTGDPGTMTAQVFSDFGTTAPSAATRELPQVSADMTLPAAQGFVITESAEPPSSVLTAKIGEEQTVSVRFQPYSRQAGTEAGETLFSGQYVLPEFILSDSGDAAWLQEQVLQIKAEAEQSLTQIQDMALTDHRRAQNAGTDFYCYSAFYDLRVSRMDARVVSLLQMSSEYNGGAHPNNLQTARNLDLAQHRELTLSDVLQDFGVAPLLDQLLEQLENRMESLELAGLYPEYRQIITQLFASTDLTRNWYFSPAGLVIYFNSYDIAPHAAGVIRTEFPYEQLDGILKPEYLPMPPEDQEGEPKLLSEAGDRRILAVGTDTEKQTVYIGTDTPISDLRLYRVSGWVSDSIPIIERLSFASSRFLPTDALKIPVSGNDEFLLICGTEEDKNNVFILTLNDFQKADRLIINQSSK